MKVTENKDKRLTVRISDSDLRYLRVAAASVGQTSSQLVRMFVDTTVNAVKLKIRQGELKLEDYEAVFNDKL